jgi:hypothetical protein
VKSKLPHVGTTIFSVMSSLAVEHNAINLSQGFPNFPVDEYLLKINPNTYEMLGVWSFGLVARLQQFFRQVEIHHF